MRECVGCVPVHYVNVVVAGRPRLFALDKALARHVGQLLRQGHLYERRLARNTLQAGSSIHTSHSIAALTRLCLAFFTRLDLKTL